MIFDDATRAQIDAARPDASTWLAANAGSGKTRVLTDRVARLLLNNVQPDKILCLTYTKAAASEMQNRLFRRLGEWAMLKDDDLRSAMAQLGIETALTPVDLRKARTLFALAIETPGGLKIQTIHSFCASLLRRFPLEAGVSPQFKEVEDRAADLLRAEIVDRMASDSASDHIAPVARFYTGEDFAGLTRRIVGMRDRFGGDISRKTLLDLLDQPADLTQERIESSVFLGGEQALLSDIIPYLLAKGGNDGKAGEALRAIETLDLSALLALEGVLLTKSGKSPFTAKIGSFPTKPTQEVIAAHMPALDDLMQRVEAARPARLALELANRSEVLHRFAREFLTRYETAKQLRGWLDFDDLIDKARALLNDPAVAAWVLYRIDGGIDHILVDEAQDTSPRQWEVIEKLADEFNSGQGARPDVDRTLFVVGDKKQSIYSFQGADPREFDHKGSSFGAAFDAAGKVFQHRSLDYSFRSSSAILRLVDTAFDPRQPFGFANPTAHLAFKDALPGRVDLWPLVEKAKADEDRPWTDPVDRRSARHHTVILAEKIADRISDLTRNEHYIPDDDKGRYFRRRIQPGDFLILVQRRSALFAEIIRACKAKGLAIAGADRLKVGAELAVKDLGALLSFLATPDDDLSLATALKSPLFGWSEQALFDLAHRRNAPSLWQALRGRTEDHSPTIEILRDLRAQIDFLRPYDLIERILTRHDGRRRLLSRLGPEAEDGVNAMLTQALAYERNEIPSLTGFIEWMQTDDLEIKRQIDSASNQIRVMTVHGSKGLEAPIVILPDTGQRTISIKDEIIALDGVPVWKPAAADMPDRVSATIEEMKQAQFDERLRLLYVAMTRAEKWLMVAAAGDLPEDGSSWYQIVEAALSHVNAVPVDDDGTLRFEEGDWHGSEVVAMPDNRDETAPVNPTLLRGIDTFAYPPLVWSPSDLGGAKALPGEAGADQEAALAYGVLVHRMLETLVDLSVEARPIAAAEMLHAGLNPRMHEAAQAEALAVLNDPALAPVFAPGTLAEVQLTAPVEEARFNGIIDRLVLSPDRVLVVDYKTNRVVPQSIEDCPDGLLQQMGAYVRMLATIYPDRQIETAILWTADRTLMRLPNNIVLSAFDRLPYLDAPGPRS
ncbi:ATP-dependent helicase/nuclease subunit A [Sulfitobacter sp. THAF37]|uniref:double-strand break repair helicase AddA n=1 Tax=Sulfitobacter sp. THAF37 TaxID=2587855 RepID=UPI001268CFBD|nr:double-strand break repair helicase AddA [Sulfitobacter sp. THAF37]QFT58281.1 ATP-dependent helicase/nuclease subunit A [Sulfitobacter sp. THAF37]